MFDPVAKLRGELDEILGAPALAHAHWAVMVQSLDSGEVLYRHNESKLMMPASNMKIVTMAAAAERLGWDFRFETALAAAGPVTGGVLRGDLLVVGRGDPTINARGGERTRVFDEWAAKLREAGIRRIEGRIIGDDDAFDEELLGAGWAWDYLAYAYATPGGALQFNENIVELVVRPAAATGQPAHLELRPAGSGLVLANSVQTAAPGSPTEIELRRLPGQATLEVAGAIAADAKETTRTASVDNPTLFFVSALRDTLVARGIAVGGDAVDVDALPASERAHARTRARVIATHLSEPLSEFGKVLMKVSQNLYADTLLKTLGAGARVDGTIERPAPEPATVARGREAVRDVLTGWGVPETSYVMSDGSGLSRYNYVTAEMLVTILRRMYRDPRHAERFETILPIAGEDGTLRSRMRNTRAAGNARAKTGSIANVRALSGYVRTADGERLVFSTLANHFNVPASAIDGVTDLLVERLANFTRQR